MTQTQSLRKKNSADKSSTQPLQRNSAKNASETLDKKTDSGAEQDNAPLQKKAYRSALSSGQSAAQDEPRLQTKLSVSTPGDSHEQEADRVADEVVSRSAAAQSTEENKLNPGSTKPENNSSNPQSLQTKISRMAEPAPAATETPQTETQTSSPTETATDNEQGVSAEVEQQIAGLRGQGEQLPEHVRTEMESQFNHDFSSVSIHNDGTADTLCKQLSARAFTVGSDIFFASGEYAPDSQEGKRLLAHELTHVVQQGSGVTRKVMRVADPEVPGAPFTDDAAAADAYRNMMTLDIPGPKSQHVEMYQSWVGANRLSRPAGRAVARNTRQIPNWLSVMRSSITETLVREKLERKNIALPIGSVGNVSLTVNGRERIEKTVPELTDLARIPRWDRLGQARRFQVDHMVEYQAASEDPLEEVDTIHNYELFDPFLNGSSGSSLRVSIVRNVKNFLSTRPPHNPREEGAEPEASWAQALAWLRTHRIIFEHVRVDEDEAVDNVDVGSWSVNEIQTLKPFEHAAETPQPVKGDPGTFVLASSGGGFELARIGHRSNPTSFAVPSEVAATAVKGFHLGQIELNGNEGAHTPGADIGTIQVSYSLPPRSRWTPTNPNLTLPLKSVGEYIGAIEQLPALDLNFRGLSPVHFDNVRLESGKVYAEGELTPSIPLFNAPVLVTLDGDDVIFSVTYSSDQLDLPIPGVSIDDANIILFYSAIRGFGANGNIFFSVPNLGDGNIGVSVSESVGLGLSGEFNFDSELFDRAQIQVWYREHQFGCQGTIGIDTPDKIKGIRSAEITVGYSDNAFTANGRVSPSVPGVEEAGLNISYGEETGLVIGGTLALNADTPGIESGSVDVTLHKQDGEWKVAATGTAVPSIPGINSNLIVDYNDGAFTAEVSADYSRGMLSGQIHAGVTNRTVNEDGTLAETASDNNELVVFGDGELTIQIAPWLQGTAGVRFAPNGEITVIGRIELPGDLEIFARQEINRSIFNIAVQAPIFPGVVAEIGGGLSATAGIGPGVIDQLALQIEYNPAHEEDTHITGDAHLNIPANAGLRLSVRAGIGLGITGASATGGLDIGGTLGIEGAAEAGVHVDWTPATGLDISAVLGVHAQPSFTFDIGGYVSVRALGFEVYDNRWEFASYTFGSDYRFGIRLPIHYHEGEPFEVSTDDIEFEVPDIDTEQLLSGLIERIA